MLSCLSVPVIAALVVLGLVGGIGITALGPGGVLPSIGLVALTGLSAPAVAGTAIVTHIATGIAGTAAYTRSGQLRRPGTRRIAAILVGAAVIGTPVGVWVNTWLSRRAFGIFLAVIIAAVALLLWYRESARRTGPQPCRPPRGGVVALVGLVVAVAGGVVGVGGPMLAVPILIACGVGVLDALAAAQVQSIVIAAVGSVGYAAAGAIDWPLAVLIGVPELAGVFLGWKIAHALPTHALKRVLIVALLALAPYLAVTA